MKLNLSKISHELRETLQLALPLMVALIAQMGIDITDTIMIGHLGVKQLAGSTLSGGAFATLLALFVAAPNATGVLIAQAYGAKNEEKIKRAFHQGFYFTLLLSVPAMMLLWSVPELYHWIGQPDSAVFYASRYLHAVFWGFPGLLCFFMLRELTSALGFTRIIMLTSSAAIPVNVFLNYILMYGKCGLPALGIAGVGVSTAIVEWSLFATLLFYCLQHKKFRSYLIDKWHRIDFTFIKNIFKLAWPISLIMLFEMGLFTLTAVLMGYVSEDALAAHQIAIQSESLVFMLLLGLGQATGIRVGRSIGARSLSDAKNAAHTGIFLGLCVAIIIATLFVVCAPTIIRLFIDTHLSHHAVVTQLAVSYLMIAAVFQFPDAIQVISNSALRGMKDTLIPMWLGLTSYWVVGLSTGALLAFYLGYQGQGLWWGLTVGIFASGILLMLRLYYQFNHDPTL